MGWITELLALPSEQPEGGRAGTGFTRLDEMVGGFNPGRLWLLTGAPGQGRTTLLTQWAAALSVEHGWRTVLLSPREEPQRCVSRLVASVGRIPLGHLLAGNGHLLDRERAELARARLQAAPLYFGAGGPDVTAPAWDQTSSTTRALLIDDVDLISPPLDSLRTFADEGAFVAVTIPRHLLVRGDDLDADLDPEWARAADLVLEVRSMGCPPGGRQVVGGTATVTVLRNRRGPLFDFTVSNECWRGRFAEQHAAN